MTFSFSLVVPGLAGVLLAVDGVLDGVLGVALDGLGPVEQVVGEVLRVVDDVGDEAGEGVLALGHLRLLVCLRPVSDRSRLRNA